jgi:hypothetical protein
VVSNKERHRNNSLPIEQRSKKVHDILLAEVFSNELSILQQIIDISDIPIKIDDGLILEFNDTVNIKEIKKFLKNTDLYYRITKNQLRILKGKDG